MSVLYVLTGRRSSATENAVKSLFVTSNASKHQPTACLLARFVSVAGACPFYQPRMHQNAGVCITNIKNPWARTRGAQLSAGYTVNTYSKPAKPDADLFNSADRHTDTRQKTDTTYHQPTSQTKWRYPAESWKKLGISGDRDPRMPHPPRCLPAQCWCPSASFKLAMTLTRRQMARFHSQRWYTIRRLFAVYA